jgi:rhodanese-related sulfurtransferase
MDRLLEYMLRHPFLAGLAVAMGLAVLVYELRTRGQTYSAVRPQEAIQLMNHGAQVYDVRSKEDFAAGHIHGAKHLDPDQMGEAPEKLKRLKERTLLLVCERGLTAGQLTRKLHAEGFTKVFNLQGGLAAWRTEGLPLQKG